ncbi:MAG: alpha-2-macroglobulin family protein, partial [Planctomycetota bacterium]
MNFKSIVFIITVAIFIGSLEAAENKFAQAQKAYTERNYKDALGIYKVVMFEKGATEYHRSQSLGQAMYCLQNLNRVNETDKLFEDFIEFYKDDWKMTFEAAKYYQNIRHYGYIIAGEFKRGQHRGGGQYANSNERDRVMMLRLLDKAVKLSLKEKDKRQVAVMYIHYARALQYNRYGRGSWRLQYLTDLENLPDYEKGGHHYYGNSASGTPVDKDGKPVFHKLPSSYDAALTDGERWRYLLMAAMEADPHQRGQAMWYYADFLNSQFGVRTVNRNFRVKFDPDKPGLFSLNTLKDNETVAKLATGVRRFTLPDEFNHIKAYKDIIAENGSYKSSAIQTLAQLYENRLQYEKAVNYWKQYIVHNKKHAEERINQITNNWGQFEPTASFPKDKGAHLDYKFRNGKEVSFEAYRIDIKQLLSDVKNYIKSNPGRIDWQKINISNIGYRLVYNKETKYLKEKTAEWKLALSPRAKHFDRRITIETPLKKGGAYLLKAKMKDGNISRIIVWINDTVIVKKNIDKAGYYFVADAVDGSGIGKANLEFFGYKQKRLKGRNKYNIETTNFAEYTDEKGQFIAKQNTLSNQFRWLIVATNDSGRFAFSGFKNVWYSSRHDYNWQQVKSFGITDRPVYRPAQKAYFKVWVRKAEYGLGEVSLYAMKKYTVRIHDGRGQKIFEKTYTSDPWGGIAGELDIAKDATLGSYRLSVKGQPWGHFRHVMNFRVEEYKKPEYEVTVEAPDKPVMLGEKISAKIKAKYYFGAPVTDAKVTYKVLRYPKDTRWYPAFEWDWLYGNGYWWFAYDYDWYPGWREWGCRMPYYSWYPRRHTPPEVILDEEGKIDENGEVVFEIDTALAKEIHGDIDHRYEITATVRDKSRRTIVGKGEVLVARKAFNVNMWLNQGYYRTGQTIKADISARTISGKPVKGKGTLKLLSITYDKDGKPTEKVADLWHINTDDAGKAANKMTARRPGQYRLSYTLNDGAGHSIEGGYVFVVRGKGFDGKGFRFNHLELITDKTEYAPGEEINLLINTEKMNSTVLLFTRPQNGIYSMPEVIRIDGKSTLRKVKVAEKDMPNFYVEAVTIADGRLHSIVKEIHIPPVKRVLNVEIESEKGRFKPGEYVNAKIRLTDLKGKPFTGSAVVTVYDKSVEYISGGANTAAIKEFFWKWKRSHHPRTESSLVMHSYHLGERGEKHMRPIGIFGNVVADFTDADEGTAESNTDDNWDFKKRKRSVARNGEARVMMSKSVAMDSVGAAPAAEMELKEEVAKMPVVGRLGKKDKSSSTEVKIRKNFADTAYWKADVFTNKDGYADIMFKMPENLGTWKFKVWGMSHGTRVGEGSTELITTKDLIIRMQAPRFFMEKDYVILSANIHNYHKRAKKLNAILEIDGKNIIPVAEPRNISAAIFAKGLKELTRLNKKVTIPAGGEMRLNWWVKVEKEGEAVIRMKAIARDDSDAVEMKFPVYVHGFEKMVPFSGVIRPDAKNGTVTFEIPKERRQSSVRVELRYSPTLAGAMLDALPYLAEFPYGCTEQTLNRFLPSVITQKVLQRTGIKLEDLQNKITNLNAQEIGDDEKRAKGWKRWDRNPVFEKGELTRMVKEGVKRLTNMQISDGGWGWFSGYGEWSYPHTTAVVVHGLQTARENDVAIVPGVISRGINWLKNYQQQQVQKIINSEKKIKPYKNYADNMDAFIYMVLADEKVNNTQMKDFLFRDRAKISVYGLSMYGIALDKVKDIEKRDAVVKNIEQYLVEDKENQTAYLNIGNNGYWWYWYGSEWETHAYYLKLLSRVAPKSERAAGLVKYLLNNRKHATYWKSTRDTAACIEAFADYLKASGEDSPDMKLKVLFDGKTVKEVKINKDNLFTFDNKFILEGDAVTTGKHTIEIVKEGTGPVYFNTYVTYFSLEDYITKAGLELKVERNYYKMVKEDKKVKVAGSRGQAVDQKVEKFKRIPIKDLDVLTSGD